MAGSWVTVCLRVGLLEGLAEAELHQHAGYMVLCVHRGLGDKGHHRLSLGKALRC